MIRKLIFLTILTIGINAFAQELAFKIPDYKAIEKEIKDKNSSYYYPKLMERLVKNDTLLNH